MGWFKSMFKRQSPDKTSRTWVQALGGNAYAGSVECIPAVRKCLELYASFVSNARLTTASGGHNGLIELINRGPNQWDSRTEFFKKLIRGFFLAGNSYSLVKFSGDNITAIIPYPDHSCYAYANKGDLSDIHEVSENGWHYKDYRGVVISNENILHVSDKTFSNDLINGRSRVYDYLQSLDAAQDLQSTRGMFLKHRLAQRAMLATNVKNPENQKKTAVAIESFQQQDKMILTLPPEVDLKGQSSLMPQNPAAFLETLYSQTQENIALAFGVPVELIARQHNATNLAGLKEIIRHFVKTKVQLLLNQIAEKLSDFSPEPLRFETTLLQRGSDLREISQMANALGKVSSKSPNAKPVLTNKELRDLIGI